MSFVYLAIPYSSKLIDPEANAAERASRMAQFWTATAYLIDQGHHVVSPITLEPAQLVAPGLPHDWTYWKDYSLKMIGISSRLIVLMLDGWGESTGVHGEIQEALSRDLPVEYLSLNTVENWLAAKHVAADEPLSADDQSRVDAAWITHMTAGPDGIEAIAQSLFRAHRDRGQARRQGVLDGIRRPVFKNRKLEEACVDATWETLDHETKEALLIDALNLRGEFERKQGARTKAEANHV